MRTLFLQARQVKILMIFFLSVILLTACGQNDEEFKATYLQQCKGENPSSIKTAECQCSLDKMLENHSIESLIKYESESDVSPLYSSLQSNSLLYCELQTVFQTTCEKSSKDLPLEVAVPYCACSYEELVKHFSPKELSDMHKGIIPVADNFIDIYAKTAKACLSDALDSSFLE
ncbi:hypothetical protein [Thorsellia kenyensis]|uniref:Lipoprotein n=1 Tax=Thorsellia kenyensis TaxID=1549888 RepID=A0ABV6CB78_9GAMM